MGTKAIIKIEGNTFCQVYKHWDGYPESTLPFLEKFNKDFSENRGDDAEYKTAQLLRATKRLENEFNLDSSNYTGWGVMEYGIDCGEEFQYTLKEDGTVTVKEKK